MNPPARLQDGVPTCIASVPAWEIDANGHWSTMFYLSAFEAASARYALSAQGLELPAPPRVLHLRFFRELRLLDTLRITSVRLSSAQSPYTVGHEMRHGVTGKPVAWALELRDKGPDLMPGDAPEDEIAPGSLEHGPDTEIDTAANLGEGRGTISHVSVLRPDDLAGDGGLRFFAIQSHLTDGNAHLWQASGVTPDDFYGRGIGRVNVELKLTRHARRPAGTPVRLVSWFEAVRGKTFCVRHQLEDLGTGAALASISVVALVIDLELRKATALPEDIAAALRR